MRTSLDTVVYLKMLKYSSVVVVAISLLGIIGITKAESTNNNGTQSEASDPNQQQSRVAVEPATQIDIEAHFVPAWIAESREQVNKYIFISIFNNCIFCLEIL
jgi:hypothetical protein